MEKQREWSSIKRITKPFFIVLPVSVLFSALAFAPLNHVAMKIISTKSEYVSDTLNHYSEKNLDQPEIVTDQALDDFRDHLIYSPRSGQAVGWLLLESATKNARGDAVAEVVVRQALNRLEGFELLNYMDSLRDSVKGFRPDGYIDILDTESGEGLDDKVRQDIIDNRDIFILEEDELVALRGCYRALHNLSMDLLPIVGDYQWMLYTIIPELAHAEECSLSHEIALGYDAKASDQMTMP